MQCPLGESSFLSPRLNHRNPHELHWRDPPPEFKGSIGKAHRKLHPHMVDEVCCLQCGAIPCPFDHAKEKHERIRDMEFVRELVKEKKDITEQLAKAKEQLQELRESNRAWRTDKLMMQAELKDYEQLRKEWEREKSVLEAEVNRLHSLNSKHQDQLKDFRENLKKIMGLTQENEALKDENNKLKEEGEKYKKMIVNQSNEMVKLETKNRVIQKELDGVKLELQTTKSQMEEAVESMRVMRQKMWDNENEMEKCRSEMQSLLKQLTDKTKQFEEKEFELEHLILTLKDEITSLKDNLSASQQGNADLRALVAELQAEIDALKKKIASDKRFKQFVRIKREVNDLKDINETLFQKVCENPDPIPIMKKSGRVKVTMKVTEPIPRIQRPKSAMMRLTSRDREERCSLSSASTEQLTMVASQQT